MAVARVVMRAGELLHQRHPQTLCLATLAPASPVARIVVTPANPSVVTGDTVRLRGEAVDSAGRPVPVVLFAGRFMRFKRLQLLIEAHHALRSISTCRPVSDGV